jgi:PAS domain S-box-containing protein
MTTPPAARGLPMALVGLLVLLLAVLWAGLFLHLSSERRLELDRASQDVRDLTRVYAEQIHSTFSAVDQTLLLLKQIHEQRDTPFNPAFALADNVLLKGADLRVRVVGADGVTIYSTDNPTYVADTDYFRFHRLNDNRHMFIGKPEFLEPNGEPLIDLSRRLDRPDGTFDGVVVISFDPRALNARAISLGTGPSTFMSVIGLDHVIRVLAEGASARLGELGEPLNAPQLFALARRGPAGVWTGTSISDGVDRIIAWQTLANYPLVVVAARDQNAELAEFDRHRAALITATAAISGVLLVVGWLLLAALAQRAALAASVRQQERQLRAIMDNAPVSIFLKDRDGRYLVANQTFAEWMGIPAAELIGRTDAELSPEIAARSRDTDEQVLAHGRIARVERRARRVRPGYEHVEVIKFPIFDEAGTVTGLSGFIYNITERRRIEQQLREAAKLEAVGRLAGGIAHDFNNMIGAISGFASFLLEDLAPSGEPHRFATRIAQVCRQAKYLVAQVLAFARAGKIEKATVDLRAAITEDAALLKPALPPSVSLTVDAGPSALPVEINRGQVHQLLLNLCVNAGDAIGGAGTIAVRLAGIDPGDPCYRGFADELADGGAAPGAAGVRGGTLDGVRRYATLEVADSGCGMDQATLERAFEPFYSTKPADRGTGLGLAVVSGIVAACDGAYRVSSRTGAGSTFSIYLPLANAPPALRALDAVADRAG